MNKEDEKVLQPKIASREVTMHILKAFGLRMSKKLGQNFLIDARIVQGIVDAAEVKPGDRVLEIGPGIGTLTQGLAEAGADVTAVELDKKLPTVLKPGGRVAILTFHSGEDRLVKKAFKQGVRDGVYREAARDVVRPSAQECYQNPRAHSTKMRWAIKA